MHVPLSAAIASVTILVTGATARTQDPHPTFSAGSNVVVLHVAVRDDDGEHVPGLAKADFTVLEEGAPQTIQFLLNDDVPVTAGLVVDSSVSMWAIRDRLVSGGWTFASGARPEDEFFALAFNERVRPALPADTPFVNDAATLGQAIDRAVQPRGRTALYDALTSALDYAAKGRHPRKVIAVVSDGGDNASATTFDKVIDKARRSDAAIYAVIVVDEGNPGEGNPDVLKRLARATGGEVFSPRNRREVSTALERVARAMRQAYTIGYAPTKPADGSYRRVTVRPASERTRRLDIRTRDGYVANAPASAPWQEPTP